MKKVQGWLSPESNIVASLLTTILFAVSYVTYTLFADPLLHLLSPSLYASMSGHTATPEEMDRLGVMGIIGCAFLEELIFRFIPFIAVQWVLLLYFHESRRKTEVVVITAILLSAIFGYLHGNALSVLMQGIAGIILSVAYLKNGGYLNRSPISGLFASTATHALINLLLFFCVWPLLPYP